MLLHQPVVVDTVHMGPRPASALTVEFETGRVFVRFVEDDGSLTSVSGWFPVEQVHWQETEGP